MIQKKLLLKIIEMLSRNEHRRLSRVLPVVGRRHWGEVATFRIVL